MGTLVSDIVVTKHQGQTIGGNFSLVSKATRKDVLLEVIKVSKALQETITASTIKKRIVDGLIKMLSKEEKVEEDKSVCEEEEETTSDNEEEEQSASEEEEETYKD